MASSFYLRGVLITDKLKRIRDFEPSLPPPPPWLAPSFQIFACLEDESVIFVKQGLLDCKILNRDQNIFPL